MSASVVRRFAQVAGGTLFLAMLGALVFGDFLGQAPGDYHVRKGSQRLSEGAYAEASKSFDKALEARPNHRGALMGRALVFVQSERYAEAETALEDLIAHLDRSLPEDRADDPTGYGVLAAAHANLGIVLDRQGRHRAALDQYVAALRVDEGAVDGPSLVDQVLYGYRASSVRERAEYIAGELRKPPEKRLLRLPSKDAGQRMYKP